LSKNEKIEQHIRKKTYKLNTLRFWIEGDVISLCEFSPVLILVRSPRVSRLSVYKRGSLWMRYSCLKILLLKGECTWLSLEEEIARYSSVSLSPTLRRYKWGSLCMRYSCLKILPLEGECTGTLTWGGDC